LRERREQKNRGAPAPILHSSLVRGRELADEKKKKKRMPALQNPAPARAGAAASLPPLTCRRCRPVRRWCVLLCVCVCEREQSKSEHAPAAHALGQLNFFLCPGSPLPPKRPRVALRPAHALPTRPRRLAKRLVTAMRGGWGRDARGTARKKGPKKSRGALPPWPFSPPLPSRTHHPLSSSSPQPAPAPRVRVRAAGRLARLPRIPGRPGSR
jgi:hypothetical protein